MGLFRKEIIEPTKARILDNGEIKTTNEPEETEEPEDDTAICVNCKHHKEEDGDHTCYANATEEIDYVTGDRRWIDVEDCEDVNEDGDCGDFEKKDMSKDQEKQ